MAFVYRRANSKYLWAKISFEGRIFRFSTKQTNERAALRVAVLQEEKLINQKFDLPVRTAGKYFDEAFTEYLEAVKAKCSFSHYRNQRDFYKSKFLSWFTPHKNIKQIEEADVVNYLEARKKAGVSNATHNRELCSLKSFFKYAKSKGWIKYPPTLDIKQLKENQAPRREYSIEESQKLFKSNHPGSILFWLSHFASLRPEEALRLKWADVDFKKGVIAVVSYKNAKTKNNKTRYIPLHEQLSQKLQAHPRFLRSEYIFCKPDGSRYKNYRKFLKRICDEAGIPYRGLYPMRHAFGTFMVESGVSLEKVQRWMGHQDVKTTMQYVHAVDATDKEMINRHHVDLLPLANVP